MQEGVYKEGANGIVKEEFQRVKAYWPCIMHKNKIFVYYKSLVTILMNFRNYYYFAGQVCAWPVIVTDCV